MALDTRLVLTLTATQTNPLDLSTPVDPLNYPVLYDWADGTAADQADRKWHDRRTLAASASEELDLAGGLTDPFGNVIIFVKVRLLLVKADATNTNNIVLGNAAANAWSGNTTPFTASTTTHRINPGGMNLYIAPQLAGFPVTAGTGDILRVLNAAGGTSVTYDITIIGTSA